MSVEKYGWAIEKKETDLYKTIMILHFLTPARIQKCLI